ncbi:MAG: phenylacetate-coenzyme A ligase PaaK-like adenylate-forming protein [Saprospiraceae bacterium]|jgi:phenylacetate-coenzyme A ligase PaaK-like adenylate-forming protein
MKHELKKDIFNVNSFRDFEILSLEIYRHQYNRIDVYRQFSQLVGKTPDKVSSLLDIPFLPISFFKTHSVLSPNEHVQKTFCSSGTTGDQISKHHVTDLTLYEQSFLKGFENAFPNFKSTTIIALLPSYIERIDSSLVYMVNDLIDKSGGVHSGFYETLNMELIEFLENDNSPKILIGVSFALWNAAEKGIKLTNTKVVETGGMKGKRKEIIREELHKILKSGLNVSEIYSEYGMTELLSQAYLTDNNFNCPPWMKALSRDISDPLTVNFSGKGAINIIDLANLNSCSFIATDDQGEIFSNGTFDVKGRIDHTQIRGCNLLI